MISKKLFELYQSKFFNHLYLPLFGSFKQAGNITQTAFKIKKRTLPSSLF
jgi:hypothetical protein